MSTFKGIEAEFNRLHDRFPVTRQGLTGSVVKLYLSKKKMDLVTDTDIWVRPMEGVSNRAHGARLFGEWLIKMYEHGRKYNRAVADCVVDRLMNMLLSGGGK